MALKLVRDCTVGPLGISLDSRRRKKLSRLASGVDEGRTVPPTRVNVCFGNSISFLRYVIIEKAVAMSQRSSV